MVRAFGRPVVRTEKVAAKAMIAAAIASGWGCDSAKAHGADASPPAVVDGPRAVDGSPAIDAAVDASQDAPRDARAPVDAAVDAAIDAPIDAAIDVPCVVAGPPRDDGLAPLCTVPIPRPEPSDIIDRAAAVRLGKALFWDVQAGSDGQIACASCHFAAGADSRLRDTMHPGPDGVFEDNGVTGPGQVAVLGNIGSDDRVGSSGMARAIFVGIAGDPASAADLCEPAPSAPFDTFRQVGARNAPTVIGAVFFRETFWDGRANHTFNGFDAFGESANAGGNLVTIDYAALASQAVTPPRSAAEMACAGRPMNGDNSLGAKLLARTPLAYQRVDPTDSVLGALSAWPENGLRCDGAPCTYRALIADAFGAPLAARAEDQFSRLWGQAIQAYEATLIPDDSPFDRFLAGDESALTAEQQLGLDLFTGKADCVACHAGPELSDATHGFARVNGLFNEDGGDQGFHNIGVRPVAFRDEDVEDLGRAGRGPGRVTFSESGSRVDRGAFKTPSLRNVKLTAPYFHNGGKATLTQVVMFYARGGDFRNPSSRVHAITFLPGEVASLVDFLENALTDCRVENQQAPFDHPSLVVANGPTLAAVGAAGTGPCP